MDWYVEGGAITSNGFRRNIWLRPGEIRSFRNHYHNTGIFLSAFAFSAPDPKAELIRGDLYFDLDGEYEAVYQDLFSLVAALSVFYGLPKQALRIAFSGNKGFHVTVPMHVLGLAPRSDLNRIYGRMAKKLAAFLAHGTLDTKIYDRRRLFRVEGSLHQESGLYKVPVLLEEIPSSRAAMEALAAQPRQIEYPVVPSFIIRGIKELLTDEPATSAPPPKRKLTFVPPCIKYLVAQEISQGQRNLTAIALASFLFQRGKSQEETEKILSQWNQSKVTPPLSDRELLGVIQNVYQAGYTYGCEAFQVLSECSPDCPLAKRGGRKRGRRTRRTEVSRLSALDILRTSQLE